MTVAAKKLAEQALALTVAEREDILSLLRDSIPQDVESISQEEWNKAWKEELNSRIEEMESGEDPGVSVEVILDDLRRLSEKR